MTRLLHDAALLAANGYSYLLRSTLGLYCFIAASAVIVRDDSLRTYGVVFCHRPCPCCSLLRGEKFYVCSESTVIPSVSREYFSFLLAHLYTLEEKLC